MPGATKRRFDRIKRAQRERDFKDLADQVERQADPFQQAKAFLQGRGYIVAPSADEAELWDVGARRNQSDRELVELAERLGWSVKPSDAVALNRRTGR